MGLTFLPDLAAKVCDGRKTQTRRLETPGDDLVWLKVAEHPHRGNPTHLRIVLSGTGRVRWTVGRDYAVQPGRGKVAMCRVKIIGIRREHIQDISTADVKREGIIRGFGYRMPYSAGNKAYINPNWLKGNEKTIVPAGPRAEFAALWDTIHPGSKDCWYANPFVWVLTMEKLE